MPKKMTPLELENAIEALVDQATLRNVLNALVNVCSGKSRHVEENWQDKDLAKQWLRAATVLDKTANHTSVEHVS